MPQTWQAINSITGINLFNATLQNFVDVAMQSIVLPWNFGGHVFEIERLTPQSPRSERGKYNYSFLFIYL